MMTVQTILLLALCGAQPVENSAGKQDERLSAEDIPALVEEL